MVAEVAGRLLPATLLVRRLVAEGGPVEAVIDFDPRLGEHHRPPRTDARGPDLVCTWGPLAVSLGRTLEVASSRPAHRCHVTPDRPLTRRDGRRPPRTARPRRPRRRLGARRRGRSRWRAWTAEIHEDLPYREAVFAAC